MLRSRTFAPSGCSPAVAPPDEPSADPALSDRAGPLRACNRGPGRTKRGRSAKEEEQRGRRGRGRRGERGEGDQARAGQDAGPGEPATYSSSGTSSRRHASRIGCDDPPALLRGVAAHGEQRVAVEDAGEHFGVGLEGALAELGRQGRAFQLERVVRGVEVQLERHPVGAEREAQDRAVRRSR